jgi:hypothetical protein
LAACSDPIQTARGSAVTASELLALLGRAWSRLLIYPGGLAAFAAARLIAIIQNHELRGPTQRLDHFDRAQLLLLTSVALPWLGLALLPLPLATSLPRQTDLIVVLALLEWPRLLATARDLGGGVTERAASARLAAALNGYPPLILATLALAQAGSSLEIAALARPPGQFASASASVVHWIGAVAWALALVPALEVGPFGARRSGAPRGHKEQKESTLAFVQMLYAWVLRFFEVGALEVGLRLRALGLVALAALPWSGGQEGGTALLRTLAAACLIGALLWGFHRLTIGQPARRWARAFVALDAVLLLALLWAAYLALLNRIS